MRQSALPSRTRSKLATARVRRHARAHIRPSRVGWSTALPNAALARAPASLTRPRRSIRGDSGRLAAVSGL